MIEYHNVEQGTDEWRQLRCGLITASEMEFITTPTLKVANNDKSRAHVWEILAQRITQFVEPIYESFDMARGKEEELDAKILYNEHYAPVQDCGFVTNDEFGFTIGYSPDGLIGDDGLIETKSRCQKYQFETIIDHLPVGTIPDEFMLQIQTGLLVTRRKWCDFNSYGNGTAMATIRVEPDGKYQEAILQAAENFEAQVAEKMAKYNQLRKVDGIRLIPTVRKNRDLEMHL